MAEGVVETTNYEGIGEKPVYGRDGFWPTADCFVLGCPIKECLYTGRCVYEDM